MTGEAGEVREGVEGKYCRSEERKYLSLTNNCLHEIFCVVILSSRIFVKLNSYLTSLLG